MSEDHWQQLARDYKREGVVLVLGAGVSIGSNSPNWEQLIIGVARKCLGERGVSVVKELRQRDYSLPAIASVIERHFRQRGTQAQFIEYVREVLYAGLPSEFHRQAMDEGLKAKFAERICESNSTLRTVASFCAVKNQSNSFLANPLVHAIITFNLDALLHTYVNARYAQGEKNFLRIIERPSADHVPGRTNIYHMHGYLRFDSFAGDPSKESGDILFTEQEYFDFFNSPTSVFNYTFLYMLREHPCLFIGLSMQDNNLRRLLHYSKIERERGLIAEGRKDSIEIRTLRHFAVMKREGEAVDEWVETSLLPLGVRVVWVDEFHEIPERIAEVYNAVGVSWSDVF
jgi:hypothetical protein